LSIDVERADHEGGAVVTVTFNRPEKLNALDLEHVLALRDALRTLAADDDVRVVVLTGAGRGFCAGGDVSTMTQPSGYALDLDQLRSLMTVPELLHTMPAVTVAAVNGPCAGAGLSFAAACDVRLAARSAVFASAFVRVGSSGDYGSAWVLTCAVGPAKARELLLLGERFDAEEARRIGLVSTVVDDAGFRDHVDDVVTRLAAMPPAASRLMKQNLNDAITKPLTAYLDAEVERFAECSGSPEAVAAAKAFLGQSSSREG
jgi:2-(1,2-epoxy-1,2-dihydrophenyl)acetyl-CoA isomerase